MYIECMIRGHMTSDFKVCQISRKFLKKFFELFKKIYWELSKNFLIFFCKVVSNSLSIFYIFLKLFQNILTFFENLLKIFKYFCEFVSNFFRIFQIFFKFSHIFLKSNWKFLRKFYWKFSNIFANFSQN